MIRQLLPLLGLSLLLANSVLAQYSSVAVFSPTQAACGNANPSFNPLNYNPGNEIDINQNLVIAGFDLYGGISAITAFGNGAGVFINGLNERGDAVGIVNYQGVLFESTGLLTQMPGLPNCNSIYNPVYPIAISNNVPPIAVGRCDGHAIAYSNGSTFDLNSLVPNAIPGRDLFSAVAISDNYIAVGASHDPTWGLAIGSDYRAYAIDLTTLTVADLGSPVSNMDSYALDVSNTGQIVGWEGIRWNPKLPMLWNQTGPATWTKIALPLPPGYIEGYASSVNDFGIAVGRVRTSGFLASVGFKPIVWNLNSMTYTLLDFSTVTFTPVGSFQTACEPTFICDIANLPVPTMLAYAYNLMGANPATGCNYLMLVL